MKIVFRYDAGPALRAQLTSLSDQGINLVFCPEGADEPFDTEMRDADVLWHILQPVTEATLRNAAQLKLIQKIGVGVNTIDLEAAKANGVTVCNMPGTNSRAVAEMTLMLMLAALRRLPAMDRLVEKGGWAVEPALSEQFGEVCGRTVGFAGFGAGPEILAPILEAMGATIAYTATAQKDVPYRYLELDDLIAEADILSLHIPLMPETKKLLNADRISAMKKGAILVNTARGGLVDEDALYHALSTGHLGAAGLDVFANEPVDPANPLLRLSNVVKAPHLAWSTSETMNRSINVALHNSRAAMGQGTFKYEVA
jgi:phosphoglycerate dehydrogenase-like enzyme